jgi:hypothetical protein
MSLYTAINMPNSTACFLSFLRNSMCHYNDVLMRFIHDEIYSNSCRHIDKYIQAVIPASEARRESFWKADSGQAGMTTNMYP